MVNWFKINITNILEEISAMICGNNPVTLTYFLNYIRIGEICKDCNKEFWQCECGNEYYIDKSIVLNFAINWACKNIDKFYLLYMIESKEYLKWTLRKNIKKEKENMNKLRESINEYITNS